MKTGARGLALIQAFEGFRGRAYLCPAGVWTIGWGHTSAAGPPAVRPGMRVTRAQAAAILAADLAPVEFALRRLVQVPIWQNQFDALASFAFNVGWPALARSTLLRRVNEYAGPELIRAAFMMWDKARDPATGKKIRLAGLARRRAAEADLYLEVQSCKG